MITRQARTAWAAADISRTARQGATRRKGVAVHWPGLGTPLGLADHAACLRLLRVLERNALADTRQGWTALPYNQVVCPHGCLIDGRGADRQSGANGSSQANREWGSVCVLIDTQTKVLSPQVKAAIRLALRIQAPGGRLVRHADVRPTPTSCPDPLLSAWLAQGAPPPQPEVAAAPRRVRVARGDTLWALAAKHLGKGARWQEIAKLNHLPDPSMIRPGQWLALPPR